jgi:hypothetical protein
MLGRGGENVLPGEEASDSEGDEGDEGDEGEDKEDEEDEKLEKHEKHENPDYVASAAPFAHNTTPTYSTAHNIYAPKPSWNDRVAMCSERKPPPPIHVTQGSLFSGSVPFASAAGLTGMAATAVADTENNWDINGKKGEKDFNAQDITRDWDQMNAKEENLNPRMRKRKMDILRRLQRRYGGPKAVADRGLNMDTSLIELEYEDENDADDDAEEDAITSAKDWSKIIFSLIEKGNQRFGPLLHLKDWANHMADEIERFDKPFRRLYRRYFSKRQSSPGWEIAWILVGSMIMFHCTGRLASKNTRNGDSHSRKSEHRASSPGARHDDEEDLPPPPLGFGASRHAQADQPSPSQGVPDLSALLGGILGNGGGSAALGGLNLGSILGMLGSEQRR